MSKLYVDGEKIPDQCIEDIFCPPPLVPTEFHRSALIIGAKGSGKTTLFRYLKSSLKGLAIHISLATEFACLAKQSAFGPLTITYSAGMEQLLVGKAISLMAISLTSRLVKKGIQPDADLLYECFPISLLEMPSTFDLQWCYKAKTNVFRSPLEYFQDIAQTKPLPDFTASLGKKCEERYGPMLLLLDRADMVPTPALLPVFDMLVQSNNYVALVAMRPGHGSTVIAKLSDYAVPGDHYDVFHLGLYPRSTEWFTFMHNALSAQLGKDLLDILGKDVTEGLTILSRDSIRIALELFARAKNESRQKKEQEIQIALNDMREKHLVAVQRMLRPYHPDFRKLINEIRDEIILKKGSINCPILLDIQQRVPEILFEKSSYLPFFIEVALRTGALCMPEGERWIPGIQPMTLEIPPLFLFRKGDSILWKKNEEPFKIVRREGAVLRIPGGPSPTPTIFIAYRMTFEESIKFRDSLSDMLHNYPSLSNWRCVDGCVPAGANWPNTIRKRIKKTKVIVGDVTGMRPDVLFELGFAHGLRKHVIPVVDKPKGRENIPYWVGAKQIGYYSNLSGLRNIVSSIESLVSDPEFVRIPSPPGPVPSLVVWLRILDWNQVASNQFGTSAEQEGLKVEMYNDDESAEMLIRRGASASLLCVSLDGTASDSLMHYICGAVLSRPKAGYGNKSLKRMILILEPPGLEKRSFTADSLARCEENAKIVSLNDISGEVLKFGKRYRQWTTSYNGKRKRN